MVAFLVSFAIYLCRKLKKAVIERAFLDKERDEGWLKFNPRDYFTLSERFIFWGAHILLFASTITAFNTYREYLNYINVTFSGVLSSVANIAMIFLGFFVCRLPKGDYYKKRC